ncbi:MAG: Rid family detoxifying hydrolase [Alkalispirochaeta sp.]
MTAKTNREIVFTDRAPAPVGPYSQANRVGNLAFVSGQLGLKPGEKTLAPTMEEQTELALSNLVSVLKEAKLGPENVVKTTCFLADMADFPTFNEIYGNTFAENPPARSCFAVKSLPLGALVEIEAIAAE